MKICIIGAGISGIVSAVILKNRGYEVDLYEERKDEIGGNCFDKFIVGNYKQKYGPHIFHTNDREVWEFVNQFTEFNTYQHKVLTYIDGELRQIPISKKYLFDNISLWQKLKFYLTTNNMLKTNNAEDYLTSAIGKTFTTNYFKNYSEKQWGCPFNQISKEIVKRIPLRTNNDPRYFVDKYQGIPVDGFTPMFENMLKMNKIKIIYKRLDSNDLPNLTKNYQKIILTGSPDQFFNYSYGRLNYRYIDFRFRFCEKFPVQQNSVINYPNEFDFTRITEFNHFIDNKNFNSSILCTEYSSSNIGVMCYPVTFNSNNQQTYNTYCEKIPYIRDKKILLLGRLGENKYLNMDAAIRNVFNKLTLEDFPTERAL